VNQDSRLPALAGACGQFAVQGAEQCRPGGEEPRDGRLRKLQTAPAVKKTNAKAKILGRTEGILLTHSQSHFTACRAEARGGVIPGYRKRYQYH